MKSQAEISEVPILAKNEETLSRDENDVSFQSGGLNCRSVWHNMKCADRWIKAEYKKLQGFDWPRTRHIVLTVKRSNYQSAREAYEDVREKRKIPALIRALEKGKKKKIKGKWVYVRKPITITNWRYYLEWHRDGVPHWHLLLEVAGIGWRTRIGGDVLRSLWKPGDWVKETYFRNRQHWLRAIGDFRKNGYFHNKKDYQGQLPGWALDIRGYVVPRSSGKRLGKLQDRDAWDDYCDRVLEEKVDPETGEILANAKIETPKKRRTFRERFAWCGTTIHAKIVTATEIIEGIFKIPYKEIYNRHKGFYLPKLGYLFRGSVEDIKEFMRRRERIIRYDSKEPNLHKYFRMGSAGWAECVKQGI